MTFSQKIQLRTMQVPFGLAEILDGIATVLTLGLWRPPFALCAARWIGRFRHNARKDKQ